MLAKLRRIVLAGVVSGVIAGLVLTGVQMVRVIPILLEAESIEGAGGAALADSRAGSHTDFRHAAHRPGMASASWSPHSELKRTAFTALANVTTAIGFGLVLCALFALRGGVSTREGVLWGLGGFAAFFVLPSLGLATELPGSHSAQLLGRQIWWLLAVGCSAGGLALLGLRREGVAALAGAALLLLPLLVGAPHLPVAGGGPPAWMVQEFLTASALANGIFWVLLGTLCAFGSGDVPRRLA